MGSRRGKARKNTLVGKYNRCDIGNILLDVNISSLFSIIFENDDTFYVGAVQDISVDSQISSFYNNRILCRVWPRRECLIPYVYFVFGG